MNGKQMMALVGIVAVILGVFRLRGKGLPSLRSSTRGDELVHIFVEIPTKLSKKQRELLEAFAAESDTRVSPPSRGFLEKLRDIFD